MNTSPAGPFPRGDFFAGRDVEQAALRRLLERLAAGDGHALLIEGEQGIGKSALLRRVLPDTAAAEASGFRLAWGTADELGQQIPLLPIRECLGTLLERRDGAGNTRGAAAAGRGRAAAGALPPEGQVPAQMAWLQRELEQLCARSPVVLVTEDLQWADPASLRLWRRLAGQTGRLRLLLVGTCRTALAHDELNRLRREVPERGGSVLSLGPLPPAHVPELVAHVAGARPGPRLAQEVHAAGGNPLYVRELVEALVAEGRVTVDGGTAELDSRSTGVRMPTSLRAVIADRLSALPADTVTALRWAAVLGPEFREGDLGTVTGRGGTDLAGVLRPAIAMGVIAETGAGLAFRHGLVRRQLYEGVPPARLLHAQVAHALADAGAPPEQVAAHLVLSADGAADWVRDWLASAVRVLAYRKPQVAGQLLAGVMAATPDSDPRWEMLQAGLVTVAFLLGRYDEVRDAGRQLLARAGDAGRGAQAAWFMAYAQLRSGRADEAVAALQGAVTRPDLSPAWHGRLRALEALALTAAGRLDEAVAAADWVLGDREAAADPFAAGYALHALSQVSFAGRDPDTALGRVSEALAVIGDRDQATDLRLMLLASRSAALGLLGRPADAIEAAEGALAVAGQSGTSRLPLIRTSLALLYFDAGRWDDALAELDQVAAAGLSPSASLAHAVIALIAGYRDDGDAAREHLRAVTEAGPRAAADTVHCHYLLLAVAVAAERAGRPGDAVAVLAACLAPGAAARLSRRHLVLPALARLALAQGDTETAAAAARAAAQEPGRDRLPVANAVAGHCRGLMAGDPEPVLAAAACHRSAGQALLCAEALTDAAVLLAEAGDTAAARNAFDEAVGLFRGLGAQWAVRGAAARLRPHGIRPRQQGYRARRARGLEALTHTEAKIARLVAGGRSNSEVAAELFLSRSTVQTHISHILAKLGVRSRLEIAAAVAGERQRG